MFDGFIRGLEGRRRLQAQFVVTASFAFSLLGPLVAPGFVLLDSYTAALISALITPPAALFPYMIRRTGEVTAAAHGLCLLAMLLLLTLSAYGGGVSGVTLPILMVVPFLAAFALTRKAVLGWTSVACTGVLVVGALQMNGADFTPLIPEDLRPIALGGTVIAVTAMAYMLASAFAYYRRETAKELGAASELSALLAELEALQRGVAAGVDRLGVSGGLASLTEDLARMTQKTNRRTLKRVETVVERDGEVGHMLRELSASSEALDHAVQAARALNKELNLASENASLQGYRRGDDAFGQVTREIGRVTVYTRESIAAIIDAGGAATVALSRLQGRAIEQREMAIGVAATVTASMAALDDAATHGRALYQSAAVLRDTTTEELDALRHLLAQHEGA